MSVRYEQFSAYGTHGLMTESCIYNRGIIANEIECSVSFKARVLLPQGAEEVVICRLPYSQWFIKNHPKIDVIGLFAEITDDDGV